MHGRIAHARWSAAIGDPVYLTYCAACGLRYWHRSSRPACRNCGKIQDFYLSAEPLEFGEASRLLSDLSGGPLRADHAAIVDGLGDVFRKLCGKPPRRVPSSRGDRGLAAS